ncbi:MAG: 3-hydroxyacyl-CoA dehydrogenase/enoyl-CoA hydratase family protein [Thermoplasmata archaeon]
MTARSGVPSEVVAVLGSGNMGSGIAQAAAQAGYTVRVRDVTEEALARGRSLIEKTLEGAVRRGKSTPERAHETLGRISFSTDLAATVVGATLVIEAVFEEAAIKEKLFAELAPSLDDEAVVATNTSSLSVTLLARGIPRPQRFAGLHFFYPAAINKLLEVIGGEATDPAVLDRLEQFAYRLRKIPIRVRDRAGFAVNRFFVPYLNEATRLLEEKVASAATIERVGRELFGTALGPFELMNVTGIPIAYHSMQSLEAAFGGPYAPSPMLRRQFEAGVPWDWKSTHEEPERAPAVRRRFQGLVFGIATQLVHEGVATAEATDRGATVGLRWARGPFALLNEAGLAEGAKLVEEYAARWPGQFPIAPELVDRARSGLGTWPLQFVRIDRRGEVAWVLLDRPEVLNSLNSAVLLQLRAAFEQLAREPSIRVVVLAGSSPVFAAGADIAEMAQKDLPTARAFGYIGQETCRVISEFPHPVVALVEGFALGGGLELALSCDFIIAAEGARLGLPEATIGIHPGMGGASRLARRIGPDRAKYLVFTAEPVSALEAARLGFVTVLVPTGSARADAQRIAEMIAARAPLALEGAKRVIDLGQDAPLEIALRLEGESAGYTFATEDRTEGMQAFLEHRPARFRGR